MFFSHRKIIYSYQGSSHLSDISVMALLGVDVVAPLFLIIESFFYHHDLQHAKYIWISVRVSKSYCIVFISDIKILGLCCQNIPEACYSILNLYGEK